jgi:hypothetical protein
MCALVKLPTNGDGQHLLAERRDEPANEIKQKIPIAEHFVWIMGGYNRLNFSRIG